MILNDARVGEYEEYWLKSLEIVRILVNIGRNIENISKSVKIPGILVDFENIVEYWHILARPYTTLQGFPRWGEHGGRPPLALHANIYMVGT